MCNMYRCSESGGKQIIISIRVHYNAGQDKYCIYAEDQYVTLSALVATLCGFTYPTSSGLAVKLEKPVPCSQSYTRNPLSPWQAFTDSKSKRTFYFNPVTRELTFARPIIDPTASLSTTITTL